MNGTIGKQAEKVSVFAKELLGRVKVPLEFRDERLTTVSAKRLMRTSSPKKTKRKARDDGIAAALVLQGYLDEAQSS